jgi:hypothetical protein
MCADMEAGGVCGRTDARETCATGVLAGLDVAEVRGLGESAPLLAALNDFGESAIR